MDGNAPRTLPAAEFKARCLALMDEVAATGEPIIITKHGKPVARLAPLETRKPKRPPIFGRHKGILVIHDSYVPDEPVIDAEAWTANVDKFDL